MIYSHFKYVAFLDIVCFGSFRFRCFNLNNVYDSYFGKYIFLRCTTCSVL